MQIFKSLKFQFQFLNEKKTALKTLGVKEFDSSPDGKKDDKIKLDVFLREAYEKCLTYLILKIQIDKITSSYY